ncbi:MAG: hypothetical protein M1820_009272 [Bogoriella megaspora]|nr:MAG: hypothetical protein M1820_009272 [Bogoriella megaspora]
MPHLLTPEGLQEYLRTSHPQWECTDLEVLSGSGGVANLTCRAKLSNQRQVVLKHAESVSGPGWSFPASRAVDENAVLTVLQSQQDIFDQDGPVRVQVPTPLAFFQESCVQISKYVPGGEDLRSFLSRETIPTELANQIGKAFGSWAQRYHAWGRSAAAAELRQRLKENNNVTMKHNLNCGIFEPSLDNFPELSNTFSAAELNDLKAMPPPPPSDRLGIIHGDFWCGNILIPTSLPNPLTLTLLDFELAQVSTPPHDIGQLFAELYLLFHFKHRSEALTIIEGFMLAYEDPALSLDEAFTAAKDFGVHLVTWPWRVGWWGDVKSEAMVECAGYGVKCVRAVLDEDVGFFLGGPLGCLFRKVASERNRGLERRLGSA